MLTANSQQKARRIPRRWIVVAGLLATVALVWAAMLIPVPYVVHRPGPTVDVLGKQGDNVVFEFTESSDPDLPSQREPGEGDGQLRMVTVSESGGPGTRLTLGELIAARFQQGTTIRKFSDLYDREVTAQQLEEASAAQMTSSHSTAAIAAMDYLGVPMDSTLTIVGAAPGSDAEGKVEDGDILLSVSGPDGVRHTVDRPSVPFEVMKTMPGGSKMTVTVDRDGEILEIPIVSTAAPQAEPSEGSKMGIYLDADTELPIDVTIHLERIGGPSAGLIFALGIIDQLTPGGITGGEVIAGTGALSFAGDVMPIGGVKQKMYGAKRDGAEWFLVPQANCDQVLGNEPTDLRVIPVATLASAVDVVGQIAAGAPADSFPKCQQTAESGAN